MPFLDHNLVEFLARVTPHLKLKDCTGKSLLKKLAEPLADHNIIFSDGFLVDGRDFSDAPSQLSVDHYSGKTVFLTTSISLGC